MEPKEPTDLGELQRSEPADLGEMEPVQTTDLDKQDDPESKGPEAEEPDA